MLFPFSLTSFMFLKIDDISFSIDDNFKFRPEISSSFCLVKSTSKCFIVSLILFANLSICFTFSTVSFWVSSKCPIETSNSSNCCLWFCSETFSLRSALISSITSFCLDIETNKLFIELEFCCIKLAFVLILSLLSLMLFSACLIFLSSWLILSVWPSCTCLINWISSSVTFLEFASLSFICSINCWISFSDSSSFSVVNLSCFSTFKCKMFWSSFNAVVFFAIISSLFLIKLASFSFFSSSNESILADNLSTNFTFSCCTNVASFMFIISSILVLLLSCRELTLKSISLTWPIRSFMFCSTVFVFANDSICNSFKVLSIVSKLFS